MKTYTTKRSFNERAVFPAIVLYDDGDVTVLDELGAYVKCRIADVRVGEHGRFGKSRVVDAKGMIWRVNGARVLEGVGCFWGYRIFRPRSVKVEPNVEGEPIQSNLVTIRAEICERLRADKSSITIQSNKVCAVLNCRKAILAAAAIESASSVSEIVAYLLAIKSPES